MGFLSTNTASMLNKSQRDGFTQTRKKLAQTGQKKKVEGEITLFHLLTLQ